MEDLRIDDQQYIGIKQVECIVDGLTDEGRVYVSELARSVLEWGGSDLKRGAEIVLKVIEDGVEN